MISLFKKLLGIADKQPSEATPLMSHSAAKPMLPQAELDAFKAWYLAQTQPAVALLPAPDGLAAKSGSRLGGPAWLASGEPWPVDSQGVPLEFLAQLDLADCRGLVGYPAEGTIQFFIGRDDLYGANFDNLLEGSALVRRCDPDDAGSLCPPPLLAEVDGVLFSDFSPFLNGVRENGLTLTPRPFNDRIDPSIKDAEERIVALYKQYDIRELEEFLEGEELARPLIHQTGGYPAFTQSDIRYQHAFADYDHVLLRLTSDEAIQWGDVGEAVFMIPSKDLANGDFSRVAYSWDCH